MIWCIINYLAVDNSDVKTKKVILVIDQLHFWINNVSGSLHVILKLYKCITYLTPFFALSWAPKLQLRADTKNAVLKQSGGADPLPSFTAPPVHPAVIGYWAFTGVLIQGLFSCNSNGPGGILGAHTRFFPLRVPSLAPGTLLAWLTVPAQCTGILALPDAHNRQRLQENLHVCCTCVHGCGVCVCDKLLTI